MPNRNTVLFTFDSIIDIPLAAVFKLKEVYQKGYTGCFVDAKLLHSFKISELKEQRMTEYKFYRKFFPDFKGLDDACDKSFNAFIHNRIDHIMDDRFVKHAITSMRQLADTYLNRSGGCIHPKVYCETEKQKQIISVLLPGMPVITGPIEEIDIEPYSRIVLGDIMTIPKIQDPALKNFLIVNFRENFMENDPKMLFLPVVAAFRDVNTFSISTAYKLHNQII